LNAGLIESESIDDEETGMTRQIRTLLAAAVLLTGATLQACAASGPYVELNGHRYTIEIAADNASREHGLMDRTEMAADHGMLFVFDDDLPRAFWMKNTKIPLDMLFFDGAGRLERIHENATPHDRTPIVGGQDIRFVLELNAGMARTLDIEPGAELRHPSVDQAIAAWPCG
jgi:uncharacterized membrane protein (UPF0127 family)